MPKTVTFTVRDRPDGREFRRTVSYDNEIRRHEAGSYTVETKEVVTSEEERPVGGSEWELLRRSQVEREYDGFGNPTSEVEETDGGRKTTTEVGYRNNDNSWLIGLPTLREVTGCAPEHDCVTRKTTYDYDDAGNPTVTVLEPGDPEMELTTTTLYGDFGTVDSVTRTDDAGSSRDVSFTYDDDKLHLTSTTDALGYETKTVAHSGLGVALETTDPNGVRTTMRYDGFGRQVETNEADGGFEHANHVAFLGFQVVSTNTAGGGNTSVLMNAIGHEIEQRVRMFDGKTATVFTEYDERGRVSRRSRPTLPDGTPLFTTNAYDNRDRVLTTTAPNAAVTRHEYTGLETHTFDPLDRHSYSVANVDGDVESAHEGGVRTRFEYGPFGQRTKAVAADDTVQTMHYDRLGRLDQHVDPSRGTSETSYNAFGEPVRQINGAGEEATLTYDDLGRVKQTTSPEGTATNTWDSADHGIGHVASATSADGIITRYTYDEFGHKETAAWTIDDHVFQLDYGYDEFGRQASLTYPRIPDLAAEDRLRVDYTYNAHGYLQQIKSPAEPKPYWQATGRNADGALTGEQQGNDVVTSYVYESTTGRLTDLTTSGPVAGPLQTINLRHDLVGNLISKEDEVSGRAEEFGYDGLDRLLTWTAATDGEQAQEVSYAYNAVGGMVGEEVAGQPERNVSYRYGPYGQADASPHALTSRTGDGDSDSYRYDDAGRQISGPRRTVEYNRFDLPTSVTWGQPQRTTTYAYDADNMRVRKHDAEQTVIYVGGVFERQDEGRHRWDGDPQPALHACRGPCGRPDQPRSGRGGRTDHHDPVVVPAWRPPGQHHGRHQPAGQARRGRWGLPQRTVLRPVRPPHRRRQRSPRTATQRGSPARVHHPRTRGRDRRHQHEGPDLRPPGAPVPQPGPDPAGPTQQPEPQPLLLCLEQPRDQHRPHRVRDGWLELLV